MKELNRFRQFLAEGEIKENALEKLSDITFETAEGNQGSATVFIEDFEGDEELFNKAYEMISKGTTSLSSGKFDYNYKAKKDKRSGDKFIELSFKYKA
jgi:hypothetical protein